MSVDAKLAAERAQARIGSVIKDKWTLDRLLGVGGMACVYAATHRNKKRAAVKMLHPEYSNEPEIRERFLREGYLANSVGHRGVVTVDDDDVAEDGSAFIVMELLDGETLEQRWRRKEHRLPLEEVLAVADQVLDALAAAHDKGVVHRDLKPENLFLTREGVIKLLDFGVGRLKELNGVSTNTLSGATMGTPAFMAPEQARGRWEEVDEQTDLWGLGATLFTLLTGDYVHEGETVNETLALAVTQPARSVLTLRADLPERVAALIDRALSYSKADRFPNARAMQAEVRLVYAQLSGQDVTLAPQLAVPEAELTPAPAPAPLSDPTAARREMTTARGVVASGWPSPLRAAWASLGHKPLVIAAVAVPFVVLLLLGARALWGSAPPASSVTLPPPDTRVVAAVPVTIASTTAAELPSSTPPVTVEQLPRERRKKSTESRAPGSSKPAPKDDPFARRR